jgi:hypothetical protein
VTSPAPAAEPLLSEGRSLTRPGRTSVSRRLGAALPTWGLIATRHLELRKRRGLMITVLVFTVAPTVLILGLRLAFHLFDQAHYGPAGTPSVFATIANLSAEFGFIIAAVVGAAAATTDLNDGVFRYLVVTGRSRLALYLARIPAGLAILVPAVAVAFTMLCLVSSYEASPQPTSVSMNNNIPVPPYLDQAQLQTWEHQHPQQAAQAFPPGQISDNAAPIQPGTKSGIATDYASYIGSENQQFEPPANEMFKIGLWLELEVGIGFLVGLGLGSLTGQRTLSTILLIGLEIIVTPIFARTEIPYFINGQRLDVGVAMDQLRPAGLATATGGGPGGGVLFGGRGALGIPPMPTWAMISVIVGWIVVWSAVGAWRMMTRDT